MSFVKVSLELLAIDESIPNKLNSLIFDNLKIKLVAIKPSTPVLKFF